MAPGTAAGGWVGMGMAGTPVTGGVIPLRLTGLSVCAATVFNSYCFAVSGSIRSRVLSIWMLESPN